MSSNLLMNRLATTFLAALAISVLPNVAEASSYNLLLTATGPSNPPSGSGWISIDTPPPGRFGSGTYLEGQDGSNLLGLSFTLGPNTFDLSDELIPTIVQFDSRGNLSSINYFGSVDGDALSVSGLTYNLTGPDFASRGAITVAAVPEPASMTVLAAGLIGLVTLRRRQSVASVSEN